MLALVVRASMKRNKKEKGLIRFGMGYPVVFIDKKCDKLCFYYEFLNDYSIVFIQSNFFYWLDFYTLKVVNL
ncbi:MAG: hypothetical protein Rsou_0004 [Candidatus Ruthia sp. Asou_11_S2]|nr:hypothetical protein [Candidatus Ruthia sp. Asou_11_S2]